MAPGSLSAWAVLFGVQPSGTGWVGWVIVAVAVVFMAMILVGDFRRRILTRIAKWRSRHRDRTST